MTKVVESSSGIGSEVRIRDYSEPLQNQYETTSYASNYLYGISFGTKTMDNVDIVGFEKQMIQTWRAMAMNPYVDFAIDDIVNEMISFHDEEKFPIKLDLNGTKFSEKLREMIHTEWITIMKLLAFNMKSYSLLRDWYIDGKQYFYIEHDNNTITSIKILDPLRIDKKITKKGNMEYIYYDSEIVSAMFKFSEDMMIELNSGLMDEKHRIWISYLDKAFLPLNQLNSLEDALLIYRIARAPERRVFYIDVGSLNKSKAETYMKEMIRNCRNKVEYNPKTGKITESTLKMSLLDDIYLPRSADGRRTEVSTLPGGAQLGELSDLDYFKSKLFRSLNVPFTRWSESNVPAALLGRSLDITRDEVKYRKFIVRLRNCYSILFYKLLKKQLVLKNIVSEEEFEEQSDNIMFDWASDSSFAELRDFEVIQERMNMVNLIAPYTGKIFSNYWIKKNILRLTDKEIDDLKDQIANEQSSGEVFLADIGNQQGF